MKNRIKYYLSSIPTILGQIENWYTAVSLLWRKQPVIIRLKNGLQFKVRSLMDVWIIKETCLDRDYDSSIQIKDGWTVVDIGAGVGDFALLVAFEHPKSTVYAFEPFSESYKLMIENINLNAIQNIIPSSVAIAAKSENVALFAMGEAVQHTTTNNFKTNAVSTTSVQAISLDDVFQLNNIVNCNLLKIDCEGCEFDILLNANRTTLQNINHIALEYHNGFTRFSHTDLVHHLEDNGFQVKVVANPVHSYLGFIHAHR